MMHRAGFYDHHEPGRYIAATADSGGLAQGFMGPVPQGYCWYVERLTSWASAARANSTVELFVLPTNTVAPGFTATVGDRAGRQDLVTAAASNARLDESSPIFVGPGYHLVAFWAGFTSGDSLLVSAQVAIHKLDLVIPQGPVRRPTLEAAMHAVPQEEDS